MYVTAHTGGSDQIWLCASTTPTSASFQAAAPAFRTTLAPDLCARGSEVLVAATGADDRVHAGLLDREGTVPFARVGGRARAGSSPVLADDGERWLCAIRGTDGRLFLAAAPSPADWQFEALGDFTTPAAPALCVLDGVAWVAAVDGDGALHLGPVEDGHAKLEPVAGAPVAQRAPSVCAYDGGLVLACVDDEGAVWIGRPGDDGHAFEAVDGAPHAGSARVFDLDGALAVAVTEAEGGALALAVADGDNALSFAPLEGTMALGAPAFAWAPGLDLEDPEAEEDADWGDAVEPDESLDAPTLHAVLVGYGKGIGVPGDIAMHREFLARLQRAGVVRAREYTALGKAATPEGVMAALDAVQPEDRDVVWCVFSGHGATARGDYLWCTRGAMMRRDDVVERVRAMNARLAAVISDCCSSEAGRVRTWSRKGESRARKGAGPEAAWRALFLEHEGMFDVTSSSEYQYSFAGVFTPALLRETLMRDPPRSWHVVFERARELSKQNAGALPEEYAARFERVGAQVESGQVPWAFALPAPSG